LKEREGGQTERDVMRDRERERQRKIETSPVKATATGELSQDDRAVRWRRRGRLVERETEGR
jgi:hypothetical protein